MNQNNSTQLANKKHVLVSLLAITFAAAVIGFAIQGLKTAKKQQIFHNKNKCEIFYVFFNVFFSKIKKKKKIQK